MWNMKGKSRSKRSCCWRRRRRRRRRGKTHHSLLYVSLGAPIRELTNTGSEVNQGYRLHCQIYRLELYFRLPHSYTPPPVVRGSGHFPVVILNLLLFNFSHLSVV